mgnify:CR=1 FL=1
MNLEKRSSGAPEEQPPQETPSGKKPVVVYIMILFVVAFLLMALSFVMHQQSNSKVLGELQDSVSAMQEIQDTQDRLMEQELSDAEDALDQAQTELDQAKEETLNAQQTQEALLALYQLQQQYSAGDMDGCLETLQRMDDEGLVDLLPDDRPEGVTSPADRYQQLKEAVLNH